jgi:hypothetical protein
VDAITLDHVLGELSSRLTGRYLSHPRLAGPSAVFFETSASREHRLWLDCGRGSAGVYWVAREAANRLTDGRTSGRSRQARLHLRKHFHGTRVTALSRVPGERTLLVETRAGGLVLRLSGPAPALTLLVEGTPVATLGEGPEAWPLPPDSPEREPASVDPITFEAAVAEAQSRGRSRRRAVLAACPGLGPTLAAELDGSASSFEALVERLHRPRPTLIVPGPVGQWRDAALAEPGAVLLAPVTLERSDGLVLHPESWLAASALFLEARRRGLAFERRRRVILGDVRRRIRRLEQLEVNLSRDLARLADEGTLRREAEALLVAGARLRPGTAEATLPDPYEPGRELTLELDPRLDGVRNAERRFAKARRAERARRRMDLRRRETLSTLEEERRREGALLEAQLASELDALAPVSQPDEGAETAAAGPRRYLTGRGLSLLVGRNARENQHLTFRLARPEDLWLHARDVPGSHVILRDPEGRAGATDLREAGEVAAFFSEARQQPRVDVHATRRKHVRPAGGGPGRVFVGHSETLRVVPRDPEGRLRRR